MMDLKPAAVLLSGVAMMVTGVYCIDAAPEKPNASVADGSPIPGIGDARAVPLPRLSSAVESQESPGSGARRILRVQLEVKGGQPVLLPESIPVLAGSPVAFTVKSDTYDRFEIPGYGVSVPVAPGAPANLAFDAVRAGHYPLQLASNGAVLGGLEVVNR